MKVHLKPAYIHRDGKGWTQDVLLVVQQATLETGQTEFPVTCTDGSLRVPLGPYHNLLHLPLEESGPLTLKLEFVSGHTATIQGASIVAELVGLPVFVEHVT